MARSVVLILLVFAQAGDGLSIRAALCENRQCTKRGTVGFEPARVSVTVIIPIAKEHHHAEYGLACDGVLVKASYVDLAIPFVMYTMEYRDVEAGECYGVLAVVKHDGSTEIARSGPLLIQARDL